MLRDILRGSRTHRCAGISQRRQWVITASANTDTEKVVHHVPQCAHLSVPLGGEAWWVSLHTPSLLHTLCERPFTVRKRYMVRVARNLYIFPEATSHTTGTAVKHVLSVSQHFPCPMFDLPSSASGAHAGRLRESCLLVIERLVICPMFRGGPPQEGSSSAHFTQ